MMARPKEFRVLIMDAAPPKPALGESCNGCGLCCLAKTCPVGLVAFSRVTGPCPALLWEELEVRYRCGLLTDPRRFHPCMPTWFVRFFAKLILRWIAVGYGCDSDATAWPDPGAGEAGTGRLRPF